MLLITRPRHPLLRVREQALSGSSCDGETAPWGDGVFVRDLGDNQVFEFKPVGGEAVIGQTVCVDNPNGECGRRSSGELAMRFERDGPKPAMEMFASHFEHECFLREVVDKESDEIQPN